MCQNETLYFSSHDGKISYHPQVFITTTLQPGAGTSKPFTQVCVLLYLFKNVKKSSLFLLPGMCIEGEPVNRIWTHFVVVKFMMKCAKGILYTCTFYRAPGREAGRRVRIPLALINHHWIPLFLQPSLTSAQLLENSKVSS